VAIVTGGNTEIGRAVALACARERIRAIVAEDRAEVVIRACAGLCGYDAELTRLAGVPVLDPVAVGVKVAEALVALGCPTRKRASSPCHRSRSRTTSDGSAAGRRRCSPITTRTRRSGPRS
jgi:allantoin racemase